MTYTRIEMEKAERLFNGLTAGGKVITTINHLAHVYRTITVIGDETGVYLDANRVWHMVDDEMWTEAERLAAKKRKSAGFKSLVKKYGREAACNIVSGHAGR